MYFTLHVLTKMLVSVVGAAYSVDFKYVWYRLSEEVGTLAQQDRRGRRGTQQGRRRNRSRFMRRRKECIFCREKVTYIDYKQTGVLRSFLTDRGKIRPRRQTGNCAKHQRQLSVAIKRARHLALLPFVVDPTRAR